MKIKEIPFYERPRERVIKYGMESISNEELIAILIRTGTKEKSAKELSLDILSTIQSISKFQDITLSRLLNIKGMGQVKALSILAALELGKRVYKEETGEKIILNTAEKVYKYMKNTFLDKKQECFYCLYFDNKQRLIERKLLFMGTINKSVVHPREIFKHAYLLSANSIICVHNHPSGDTRPSREDIILTNALIEIGNLQNIPVVDHLIMGSDGYYSFMEENPNITI